jgi:hypothetical protein
MSEHILAAVVIVVLAISSFWFLATTLLSLWKISGATKRSSAGRSGGESRESPSPAGGGSEECYDYCREHSFLLNEGAQPSCASICGR